MAGLADQIDGGLLEALTEQLGKRISTGKSVRANHSHGEGWDRPVLPAAVAFPESNEDVLAVVRTCAAYTTPIVPFGAGSSLEGHVVPPPNALSLDLTRMSHILEVSDADLDCRVQAGVTRRQLDRHLGKRGLFFPVDPGADATIGGMVATGASGTTTVRYGAMRENVLGLTVVLADGSLIRTGGRARKSSAGYDLTRLFIASEGTLGVITEITLRLQGIPESISAAVCHFERISGVVESVIEAIQVGIPLARSELVDEVQMEGFARHSGLDEMAIAPTLFLEFHGSEAAVREQAEAMAEIVARNGGSAFRWATRPEERTRLWQARHDAYYACLALAPGKRGMVTDACVPISRLNECIEETKRDIDEHGLVAPIVGHIGDGNFHSVVMCDPESAAEIAAGKAFVTRLAERAIAMGGTCTGEHGVGTGKLDLVEREHGAAVATMQAIKRALDPHDLMNPGKVVRLVG